MRRSTKDSIDGRRSQFAHHNPLINVAKSLGWKLTFLDTRVPRIYFAPVLSRSERVRFWQGREMVAEKPTGRAEP